MAAFRNSPRRRNRGRRAVALVALLAAGGAGLWWMWSDDEGGPRADEQLASAPVNLTLDEPTPRQTAQQAAIRLGRPPSNPETSSADTIAAAPERAAAQTAPAPVELRQTMAARNPPTTPTREPAVSQTPPPQQPRLVERAAEQRPSQPTTSPEPAVREPASGDSGVARYVAQGEAALAANRPVDARIAFNRALHAAGASESDRQALRTKLAALNQQLLFSPVVTPGDALVETYAVQSGDSLARIVDLHDAHVDWRLVQRVNALADPRRIRINQKLKLVRGPFHAVVHKSAYRLDLYSDWRDPDGNRLYIRSFRVGLGENNSTPLGKFSVKSGSKLINPHWVNPRTGERFADVDPKNPIGERWIGIEGAEPATQTLSGYGLHGTIDPHSIGTDASMGCVRMLAEDVELVYELLGERVSEVEIRP